MTPCARSCCWTPFSCGSAYSCACHWEDKHPAAERDIPRPRDPTARQAIKNVMKSTRRKTK